MRKRTLLTGAPIGLVLILVGPWSACTIPGSTVVAQLPVLPGLYEEAPVRWDVSWWDGIAIRTISVEEQPNSRDRPLAVALELAETGAALPVVVATPYAGPDGSIPLAPYGGWVRGNKRDIFLDRHGGEVGLVLFALGRAGVDPAVVNATRLYALAKQRMPNRPRRLDHERLVDALLTQVMRSTYITARFARLHQVRLVLDPGDNGSVPWLTDDPAEPAVQPSPAGAYELFSIPVMEGEVRRLWRDCPPGAVGSEEALSEAGGRAGRCYQVVVVHRTPAGHGFHRLRTIILSPRS